MLGTLISPLLSRHNGSDENEPFHFKMCNVRLSNMRQTLPDEKVSSKSGF